MKKRASSDSGDVLRSHGLKATPIRLALLRVLEANHEPESIQEIAKRLPKGLADQVTIYRAMESFVEKGIAREVNLRHGHVDYESAFHSDHHHLVCTSCGRMEDFDGCEVDSLVKKVLKKHPKFSSVQDHALELFGTCKACETRR